MMIKLFKNTSVSKSFIIHYSAKHEMLFKEIIIYVLLLDILNCFCETCISGWLHNKYTSTVLTASNGKLVHQKQFQFCLYLDFAKFFSGPLIVGHWEIKHVDLQQ